VLRTRDQAHDWMG
jgi:hypothetical protein